MMSHTLVRQLLVEEYAVFGAPEANALSACDRLGPVSFEIGFSNACPWPEFLVTSF